VRFPIPKAIYPCFEVARTMGGQQRGDVMQWVIFVFAVLAVLFPRALKVGVLFVALALLLACVSLADHLVMAI
jgi:hypothetical protein